MHYTLWKPKKYDTTITDALRKISNPDGSYASLGLLKNSIC